MSFNGSGIETIGVEDSNERSGFSTVCGFKRCTGRGGNSAFERI